MNAAGPDRWLLIAGLALAIGSIAAVLVLVLGGASAAGQYRQRTTGEIGRRLNNLLLFIDARRLFEVNLAVGLLLVAGVGWLTRSWMLVVIALVTAVFIRAVIENRAPPTAIAAIVAWLK